MVDAEWQDKDRRAEVREVAHKLSDCHSVFSTVWALSDFVFSDSLPTAAMEFDKESSRPLRYVFNPDFWDSTDAYTRAWVIVHESLHAILDHGTRTLPYYEMGYTKKAVNIAIDLVVNHTTIEKFGFDRSLVENAESYCWVDTIFKDPPSTQLSFGEYLSLMVKEATARGLSADGEGFGAGHPDVHILAEGIKEYIEKALKGTLADSYNEVVENFEEAIASDGPISQTGKKAGKGSSVPEVFSKRPPRLRPIEKWTSVIDRWDRRARGTDMDKQWAREPRSHSLLPRDFILPSRFKTHDAEFARARSKILLYIDVSLSCVPLFEYFYTAALTMPERRFDIRAFAFSDRVKEFDWKYQTLKCGGGGTNISAVTDSVHGVEKFDYAFVITDMEFFSEPLMERPSKWRFFTTKDDMSNTYSRDVASAGAKVYDLADFFKMS